MKKERKPWKTLLWVIGIMGIIILISALIGKCNKSGKGDKDPIKTDTVYKYVYLEPKKEDLGKVVLPETKTIYIDTGTYRHDTLETIEVYKDTVYLESRNSSAKYLNKFLMRYPKNPKLIYGRFGNDTLQLDLLNPDGQLTKDLHTNLDFSKYTYHWLNGTLSKTPNSNYSPLNKTLGKLDRMIKSESNLYLTYNPLNKSPQIAIDYSIMYKRVGVYSKAEVSPNNYHIGAGIRIKLK